MATIPSGQSNVTKPMSDGAVASLWLLLLVVFSGMACLTTSWLLSGFLLILVWIEMLIGLSLWLKDNHKRAQKHAEQHRQREERAYDINEALGLRE